MLTHLCAGAALAYALRAAQFANSWFEIPLVKRRPSALPLLSVIVPARDEERSIERCVRSLLAQEWLDFETIVVDDRSTDATPSILERLSREDDRLRVVNGAALPEGWVGKPWALHQGATIARGEWLLFTDADSAHAPRGAASALAFARHAMVDALTIATEQECVTFWERATLPFILGMVLFASGKPADINDPDKPDRALANGQYILVSRVAYDALGGHAALRAEIVEDLEFARRLKRDGRFRLLLGGGRALASVRMYRSLHEIWNGFTKNVYLGARGNLFALGVGAVFCLTISVAPPLLAARAFARKRPLEGVEALACTFATIATSAWAMRRTSSPDRDAIYQPLGHLVLAAIILNSTYRVLSGRGVEWRGRRYTGRPASGPGSDSAGPRRDE